MQWLLLMRNIMSLFNRKLLKEKREMCDYINNQCEREISICIHEKQINIWISMALMNIN